MAVARESLKTPNYIFKNFMIFLWSQYFQGFKGFFYSIKIFLKTIS